MHISQEDHNNVVRVWLVIITFFLAGVFLVLLSIRIHMNPRDHTTEIILNCNPECEFDQEVQTVP